MGLIKKMVQVLLITGSLALFGCSSSEEPAGDQTLTGEFNSPTVKGLKYSTSSRSGTTDANGQFEYKDGEVVSFYIGEIFVGQAYGRNVLTPLDLADVAVSNKSATSQRALNISDNRAINLFNLLLSLDGNGDASDGIEITAETIAQTVSVSLQLDLPPADFIVDAATSSFAIAISVTLSEPAEISTFISQTYRNNSDWGTMVWGTSDWNNQ